MHEPVLLQEVITHLDPHPNEDVIDATVNGGGHAEALLERISPEGKLLGIDRDPAMLTRTEKRLARFGDRAILAEGNFSTIRKLAELQGVLHPSCILFDLGFSSYHLASGRGFSFQAAEPLDMRYNPNETLETAEAIVNRAPRERLEQIFREYGEERNARRIAKAIIETRQRSPIKTTKELADIAGRISMKGRIHPATRIFQALRIAVNDELVHVRRGLEDAITLLAPKGRLAVISFHSLEDRIAKQIFRERNDGLATKKPITAGALELGRNPRARSAKLRVFTKQ